jgi:hypothetical protein
MGSPVTLANLRQISLVKADMEKSQFISTANLNLLVNLSIKGMYDLLVKANQDFYTKKATGTYLTTDGINDTFALPDDFYRLVGIDYPLGNPTNRKVPMMKYTSIDRNKYINNSIVIRYRILGNNIRFNPIPGAMKMDFWYIPVFADLTSDSSTFDGVNGWEDLITTDVAIRLLTKEETDTTPLQLEKKALIERIQSMAGTRDEAMPEKVQDVSGFMLPYRYYMGDEG